jgi:hypothetical protein
MHFGMPEVRSLICWAIARAASPFGSKEPRYRASGLLALTPRLFFNLKPGCACQTKKRHTTHSATRADLSARVAQHTARPDTRLPSASWKLIFSLTVSIARERIIQVLLFLMWLMRHTV